MSKLLVVFVHHDDATEAAEELRAAGYRFTHLPSVGGFLGTENTTLIMGVEDEDEPDVIALLERVCHGREVEVPLVLLERLKDWKTATVAHGGATVLVADLARIVRI
jgi:uncharacterized protein YaaQ